MPLTLIYKDDIMNKKSNEEYVFSSSAQLMKDIHKNMRDNGLNIERISQYEKEKFFGKDKLKNIKDNELSACLKDMQTLKQISPVWIRPECTAFISRVKNFYKIIVSKVCEFYFRQVIKEQNKFNDKVYECLEGLYKCYGELEQETKRLELLISQANGEDNNHSLTEPINSNPFFSEKSVIDFYPLWNTSQRFDDEYKKRLEIYVSYFSKCDNVIEFGSGNGEFLLMLKDKGIPAKGYDLLLKNVVECREKKLDVELLDGIVAIAVLKESSIGGIFASHFLEYLCGDQAFVFLKNCYSKLCDNGVLIIEGVNPCCNESSEVKKDPAVIKFYHSDTIIFFLEKLGFDIESSENFCDKFSLKSEESDNTSGNTCFSDYSIIARKKKV